MESIPPAIAVLLIDSHEGRQYWSQRLKISSADYVIVEADTGASALSICDSQRIDCVVTELALPDMSGFKVLATLVPSLSDRALPVIVLTHNTLEEMAALALKNGARGYLMKSHASGDDLDRAIHRAIAAVGRNKERHSLTEAFPEAGTGNTVLLVDDDETELQHWSDTVRRLSSNHTVLTAHDSNAAIAICRERKVDCVLLDLDMPDSGFRALLELIPDRKHPSIAVVVLTHLHDRFLGELSKQNGAQGFLFKQRTSPKELSAAIEQAIASVKVAEKGPRPATSTH